MTVHREKGVAGIALALSGGGYRAAAFHLGMLRTLDAVGLLDDVRLLSTVSGGTFIGAAYALAKCRGESFPQFSAWFEERLRSQRPVHRAAEILVSGRNRHLPRHTLIAAHAEAIDEQFFEGARFGELFDGESHLEEISFNATDFRVGLPFRFQKSRSTRVKIGHGKYSIPVECAKAIRIADIVAASSCFPGGFEPLGFPADFHWRQHEDALRRLTEDPESAFVEPVPLMDGGVADNQGVDGLVKMLDRRKPADAPIEILFISDADQRPDHPLLEHRRSPRPSGPSLGTVLLLARALTWIGAIASILLGFKLGRMLVTRQLGSWFDFVETVFSLSVVSATVVALSWGGRMLRKLVWDQIPKDAGIDVAGILRQITVPWLAELLWMRWESLFAMANGVFMRSIRALRYENLYQEHGNQIVANQIYSVTRSRESDQAVEWEPTAAMKEVAERARDMPTTLWVDDPRQLDDAILCGRFTTCRNLGLFVGKWMEKAPSESRRELYQRLDALWRVLRDGAP